MATGPERVQAALRAAGLAVEVMLMPVSARTAQMAAEAVGCDVGAIVKSLVFLADGEPVLVLCPGDKRVDTARLAALIGADRIERAPAEVVREATGYAIGGVPPLGHARRLPVYMDRGILACETVYAAGGAPEALFPLSPRVLLEVTGATLVDAGV